MITRTQRRLIAIPVAFMTALGLGACAASSDDDGQVTISMATFLDPQGQTGRDIVLNKLIESFEAENPDIKIEIQTTQWDLLATQFLAGDAAGNAADLYWVPLVEASPAVLQGAYAEITDAFTDEDKADFDDAFWRGMQVNGEQWGVALSRQTFGFLYRKDIFEQEGIELSELSTWDGFTEVASRLSRPSDGFWGFCQAFSPAAAGELTTFGARLLSRQGTFFAGDGSPAWATPDGVTALEYTVGLVEDGITPPDAAVWSNEDPYEQFSAGNCAMATAGNTRVPTIQAQAGEDKTGFALFPAETGKDPVYLIGTWTVGIWHGTPNLEAAKKWIAHLVSPEADLLWVTEAGQAPTRQSTVEQVDLPIHLETAARAALNGWIAPANMKADFRVPFNEVVSDVLVNGTSPLDALKKIEEAVR